MSVLLKFGQGWVSRGSQKKKIWCLNSPSTLNQAIYTLYMYSIFYCWLSWHQQLTDKSNQKSKSIRGAPIKRSPLRYCAHLTCLDYQQYSAHLAGLNCSQVKLEIKVFYQMCGIPRLMEVREMCGISPLMETCQVKVTEVSPLTAIFRTFHMSPLTAIFRTFHMSPLTAVFRTFEVSPVPAVFRTLGRT